MKSPSRRALHWALGLALGGTALAYSGRGVAQARAVSRVALAWEAPAGCPDRATALATLERMLAGADSVRTDPLAARVVIRAERADAWTLRLETTTNGLRGERTLTSRTCGRVADAGLLLIALAVAPGMAGDLAAPAALPRPAPRPRPVSFLVGAGLHAEYGSLPRFAPGPALRVSLALGFALGVVRIELGGVYLPEQATADDATVRRALVSRASGDVRGCLLFGSVLSGGPCAGVELGWIWAYGQNFQENYTAGGLWAVATAGLAGRVALGSRFAIRLDAAAGILLGAPTFVGHGVDLFRPSGAMARGTIALELRVF